MPHTVADLTTRSVIGSLGGEVVDPTPQVVTIVSDSPHIRLCERCWRPLSAGTVFRVFRHSEPASPAVTPAPERLSFRHLDDDPGCTGAQLADNDAERVA